MDANREETPLLGGYSSAGVVRVGDTVRRPKRDNSDFVRDLLNHLEAKHCDFVPRHLGEDDKGREIFSFIHGETHPRFQDYSDNQVAAAARLLKRFHSAFERTPYCGTERTVCHNDPGPNNAIFRHGTPYAWIDFDFAAPGSPIVDVAYLAWTWCISSSPKRAALEVQTRQVAIIADCYGLQMRDQLIDAIKARIAQNIEFWTENLRDLSRVTVSIEKAKRVLEWSHDELNHVRLHQVAFKNALAEKSSE